MVPCSSSSTLSDVRTVYSKKAYCARRSIEVTSSKAAPSAVDQRIVTRCECGGRKKAVPWPVASGDGGGDGPGSRAAGGGDERATETFDGGEVGGDGGGE